MTRLRDFLQLALQEKAIAINLSTLLTGNVLARIASALATILIARNLGPDAYGIFAAALSVARISSVFFKNDIQTLYLRSDTLHLIASSNI